MIKAVIFDADGVLVKTKIFSREIKKDFDLPRQKLAPILDTIFKKYLIGKGDLKQDLKKYILVWGWCGSVDDFMAYWLRKESELDLQMLRRIEELRRQGLLCYVGTNQEKYRTAYMKKEMGFGDAFDGVWSSADLGYKKPSPEFYAHIYARICQRTPLRREEIMFWDDRKGNVAAAREFGFDAHYFTDFAAWEKEMETYGF